nr:ATPase [Lachnospiraceae bacterium]
GRPMFIRTPDANFTLANFMRTHLYASLATLKIGCDILLKEEKAPLDMLYGHGGFFKTKGVGQKMLAAAMNAPVAVMTTAGEGGPWGMAILAAYMLDGKGTDLAAYLADKVFGQDAGEVVDPDPADVKGFDEYTEAYKKTLPAQEAAGKFFTI